MTVVVHSFAEDSSLLDCCDLVGFCLFVCLFWVFFPPYWLMLAGRQPFGGFEVVSAVLFLSFGVICLLD